MSTTGKMTDSKMTEALRNSRAVQMFGRVQAFLMPEKMYVNIEPLYDIEDLVTGEGDMFRNLTEEIAASLPCENFWKELQEFEKKVAYDYTKGKQHRFAMQCTIMLPVGFPKEKREPLVRQFMKQYSLDGDQLPWQAFFYEKGAGDYIRIFYSERMYREKGYVIPVYSRGDFYRDPETGRRCKSTKPGAVLVAKNHEKIGEKIEKFSQKIKGAGTGNGEMFNSFVSNLKAILLRLLTQFFGEIQKGIYFKKINKEKFKKTPYFLYNISKINRLILHIETAFNQTLQALVNGYMFDYDTQKEFYRLVTRWKNRLTRQTVRYNKRVVFYIKMNTKWETLDESIATIIQMFDDELVEFYKLNFNFFGDEQVVIM